MSPPSDEEAGQFSPNCPASESEGGDIQLIPQPGAKFSGPENTVLIFRLDADNSGLDGVLSLENTSKFTSPCL